MDWSNSKYPALHYQKLSSGEQVICRLCPTNCKLYPGGIGACGVRKNDGGELYSLNFGYGIPPSIETLETEAVFQYNPGARILSLGNIGCNLKCKFCQNWETSQIQHLPPGQVRQYTPEQVVQMALDSKVEIISWTYNEPVVWLEFILETARLAHQNGMLNLYKSALNINLEPLKELIEVIDVFSISLKSINDQHYKSIYKGNLNAVLEGIKLIHSSGKHLEIRQLVVTGINDNLEDSEQVSNWIMKELGTDIPLHFVAYHPAYQYNESRTSLEVLQAMKQQALEIGLKQVYLGNVSDTELNDDYCSHCGDLLIQRIGLSVSKPGIVNNRCRNCQTATNYQLSNTDGLETNSKPTFPNKLAFDWGALQSIHLVFETSPTKRHIIIQHLPGAEEEHITMASGVERILIFKKHPEEQQINIHFAEKKPPYILELLDRAHFPITPNKNG